MALNSRSSNTVTNGDSGKSSVSKPSRGRMPVASTAQTGRATDRVAGTRLAAVTKPSTSTKSRRTPVLQYCARCGDPFNLLTIPKSKRWLEMDQDAYLNEPICEECIEIVFDEDVEDEYDDGEEMECYTVWDIGSNTCDMLFIPKGLDYATEIAMFREEKEKLEKEKREKEKREKMKEAEKAKAKAKEAKRAKEAQKARETQKTKEESDRKKRGQSKNAEMAKATSIDLGISKKRKADSETESELTKKIAKLRANISPKGTSSHSTSHPPTISNFITPIEYQTSEILLRDASNYLLEHSCLADGQRHLASKTTRVGFSGTYSIVSEPKVGNKERVWMVSNDLKVIPIASKSLNPASKPGYFEKTFKCSNAPLADRASGSKSGSPKGIECDAIISISSQHDSSHPLGFWGQTVVVRISHPAT
ncbi:hypothetical protein JAAARDRAFT_69474 [Jaapia argillacea MUCL 33604]|uniref:Uncharacterized protein n=1 Tax=Jaapia argillacea MUCL 33604 TaxID=933084 RepID=A0A067PTT5_9AGAM|nr:hypothetical protein JAAARDRAFT_69474 [Jaapia argillacea MUCL 33604]